MRKLHSTALHRLRPLDLPKLPPGLHHDGGGLYLQVRPSGTRGWVLRFTQAGKAHTMGLGGLNRVTLKEARERAKAAHSAIAAGDDPIAARQAKRAAHRVKQATNMTFRQAAEAYIAAHDAGWKNPKHARQWPDTLNAYVYPVFGDLPVAAIDTGLVMKAIEPIWASKPETASRVRGRIESVLDWAKARGYRDGENPARWKGHLQHMLPARSKVARVEHHAALPYSELPAFMEAVRSQDGIAARALEFTILNAARTGETIGATWQEIDLEAHTWTVPASRMKAGREHRVPLSERAMAILAEMAAVRDGDFVFPGSKAGKPLSNMAMLKLLKRMGRGDLTTHGFRSTFMDWATERTAFPSEMRDLALAHTVRDAVEAAYRRGDMFDRRRRMMDDWARFAEQPDAQSGEVVPLRSSAAQ